MWTKTARILLVLLLISVVFLVKGPGPNDQVNALLSVASFFFGIFVSFSITNSHGRFSKIIDNLKDEEASLLFCFYCSKAFGEEINTKVRNLVDTYLMAQIDYRLSDYDKSSGKLEDIIKFVLTLQPQTKAQEDAFSKMTDLLKDVVVKRKQTEVAISQPLSQMEWGTILVLLPVIIGSIYYINVGTVLSILTSILLIIVALLLVYTLIDIDGLHWNEQKLIWKSLADTFMKLGLLPYFPGEPVLGGQVDLSLLPVGQRIRVALYTHSYPDMTKEIKILENKPELWNHNPFIKHNPAPWIEA